MKNYYAGKNDYGVNFTFNSNDWAAYVFDSKADRDAWVDAHYLSRNGGSNIVAQAITYKDALAITGATKNYPMVKAEPELQHYDDAVRVVKSEEYFY